MAMRDRPRRPGLAWLLVAGHCLATLPAWADNRVAVIAAAGTPIQAIGADDLASLFRRKKQFLAGQKGEPINLPAQHPLRRHFSQQVLHKTPEELEDYWREMYFNGVNPPFVLASEEAVIRFVAGTPGAVGYVSQCAVDRRVVVVMWIEGGPGCSK